MLDHERCDECGRWGEECAFPSPQDGCGCARCLRASRDIARQQVDDLTKILIREGSVEGAYERRLAEALRERDEARAALRAVAEKQRAACEKYAFCQACANAVGSAALITEGDK